MNEKIRKKIENNLEDIIFNEKTTKGDPLLAYYEISSKDISYYNEMIFIDKATKWFEKDIDSPGYLSKFVIKSIKNYYRENQEKIDRLLEYELLVREQ